MKTLFDQNKRVEKRYQKTGHCLESPGLGGMLDDTLVSPSQTALGQVLLLHIPPSSVILKTNRCCYSATLSNSICKTQVLSARCVGRVKGGQF